MSKLICYSLFNGKCEPFEKAAYVRGFYFNARMNNLIYPDWRTHLEVDRAIYSAFKNLFDWLVGNSNLDLVINENTPPLCEGMLWRMKPIFTIDVDHILCRDSDAITTYREAQAVQAWIESKVPIHAINDNPSHGGLMGGMVGFDCSYLKAAMGWHSFEQMISGLDLSQRGSDQHFLNSIPTTSLTQRILLLHKFTPQETHVNIKLPQVDPKLWESDLTCRHIGSAGVVEMETIRFFKRFDEYQWKFDVVEKQFPNLFYWHQ